MDSFEDALAQLNLEPIIVKLMHPDDGEGWPLEQALRIEQEYRRFLTLNHRYPDTPIVPSKVVDEFWHTHILDTEKYSEDCHRLYGRFLHHFPYFGLRGEVDKNNLHAAFEETLRLYEQTFGTSSVGYKGGDFAPSDCSRGCSPNACTPGGCNPGRVNASIRPSLATVS